MKLRSFSYLTNVVLIGAVLAALSRERVSMVLVVALLEEVDRRKLYAAAGYPSTIAYCIGHFRMSVDSAFKRIRAARAARRFPGILDALEDGRLHLSAVVALAPYLRKENGEELVAAATHKTRFEIEQMLAKRFPRPDVPARVQEVSPCSQALTWGPLAPGPVETGEVAESAGTQGGAPLVPERVPNQRSDLSRTAAPEFPRMTPLAPQRFAVQFTMDQGTHDDLVRAQELLSHQIPSGDIAEVFALALRSLNRDLMKRKFAATQKPRPVARPSEDPRHIPASVKREVWERDGGKCTFVSDTGVRCSSRRLIEFDHVTEVARGGVASLSGIRLRCRAHNQYAAECTFGAEFMRRKRETPSEARAEAKMQSTEPPPMTAATSEPAEARSGSRAKAPQSQAGGSSLPAQATSAATLAPGPVGND